MDSAGIPWYSTGTVNVTQGSTNITGVGTNWINAGLKKGDIFTIDKSRLYQITAVNNNTSITLQEAYQGATGTAQVYFVIRNFTATMQAEIAAQVAELVNKYESYIDTELKQITGPAGPTSFPYRGTWATGRSYNGLDVVQYGNQLYMALYGHTSTSTNAPGATGTAWTQLTFDAAFSATQAEIAAVANAGAKNRFPNLAIGKTETVNGVTFNVNTDGSVTINGKNTSAEVNTTFISLVPSGQVKTQAGKYIMSGVPKGYANKIWTWIAGVGENRTEANKIISLSQDVSGGCGVSVAVGDTQFDNVIVYPMLRDAAIEDDTYVPYGMSNAEITGKLSDTRWLNVSNGISCRKKNGIIQINMSNNSQAQTASDIVIGTLPEGFRPTSQVIAIGCTNQFAQHLGIVIGTNGEVKTRLGTGTGTGFYGTVTYLA